MLSIAPSCQGSEEGKAVTVTAGQSPDPASDSALGGRSLAEDPREGPSSSTPTHPKGHPHE